MNINIWIILFVGVTINLFASPMKSCSANQQFQPQKPSRDERADGVKSGALNNFLASVLRAKDELNWIDRTIYSRTSGRKLREVRRKLFWSDDSSVEEKRRKMKKKKREENIEDLSDGILFELNDDVDYKYGNVKSGVKQLQRKKPKRSTNLKSSKIETLSHDLKLNKRLKRSSSNNYEANNISNGKKRYPIIKNVDIEYFDYETDMDKRDLSDKTPTTTENSEETGSVSPDEQKKIDEILKMYEKNNAATYEPPKQKYRYEGKIAKSQSPKSNTIVSKRKDDELSEDDKVNSIEYDSINNNIANVDGNQAAYNRNQDDDYDNTEKFNSATQDYKIISNIENSIVTNLSQQLNYQNLKATDDLFKGGMEQDDGDDDDIPIAKLAVENNSNTVENKFEKFDKFPINKLNTSYSKFAEKFERDNENEREINLKSFKGSIIHHESIVEPLNWPWENYDEKDDTGMLFGRRLMQSSTMPKIFEKKKKLIKQNDKYLKNHSIDNENFNTDENSSQKYLAISGKLAIQITDKIFEKININDKLKKTLSSSEEKSRIIDEMIKKTPLNLEIKNKINTKNIMKKLAEILSRVVIDEMEKKSCTKLPPQLGKFLQCMVVNEEKPIGIRKFSHPSSIATKRQSTTTEENKTEYSFPISTIPTTSHLKLSSTELDEIYRKIRLLNGLIKEYHLLSSKEQTKFQLIHDYLERQLDSLINYVKLREQNENNISFVTKNPQRFKHNSRLISHDVNNFITSSVISGIDKKKRKRRRVEKIYKKFNSKNKILKHRRYAMTNFSNNFISKKAKLIYPMEIKLFLNNTLNENNNLSKLNEHCLINKTILEKMAMKNDRELNGKLLEINSIVKNNLSSVDELNIKKIIPTTLSTTPTSSYNSSESKKIITNKKIMNNKSKLNQEQETARQIIESKINVFPVD
ncbi:hypothetical protein PV326_003491 [Microctonus aethiopoides]|nr:hypothetical protein PV326_003491 [Microctonus aethiopoides]